MFEIDESIISSEELTEKVKQKVREKNIPLECMDSLNKGNLFMNNVNLSAMRSELNSLRENVRSMNNLWYITELPLRSNHRVIGKAIVFIKKCIRKCLRWMINPYLEQVSNYNSAVTRALSSTLKIQQMLVDSLENADKESR